MTTDDYVRLHDVVKVYGSGQNQVRALNGVTVAFPTGTFTAVMGPSGSGKSTLLQCAAGLDRPTSGQVTVGGDDLGRLSETQLTILRRDRIGFVFQAFNLMPSLTAEQNVELPLRLGGRRPSHRDVRDVLASVGLAKQARRRPGELSGGQQQRVAIARALITRPRLLFADEPTGALDTNTGREVLQLLRDVGKSTGMTIIMVTHNPSATTYTDRALLLVDGRVHAELERPDADAVTGLMARLDG